MLFKCSDR